MGTAEENNENAPVAFLLVICAGLSTGIGAGFVFNKKLVSVCAQPFPPFLPLRVSVCAQPFPPFLPSLVSVRAQPFPRFLPLRCVCGKEARGGTSVCRYAGTRTYRPAVRGYRILPQPLGMLGHKSWLAFTGGRGPRSWGVALLLLQQCGEGVRRGDVSDIAGM